MISAHEIASMASTSTTPATLGDFRCHNCKRIMEGLRAAPKRCPDCQCSSFSAVAFSKRCAIPNPAQGLTPSDAWKELVEYDDRTSPEEYPDMALITADELADFMARTVLPADNGSRLIETAPRDALVLVYGYSDNDWDDMQDAYDCGDPIDEYERHWYPAKLSFQNIWWLPGGMMQQVRAPTHWMPLPAAPALSTAPKGER